jgi:hypothetical protein
VRHTQQIVPAPMELVVNPEHHGVALLRAGQFATVQTRPVNGQDHLCGNEVTFYRHSRS